MAGNKDEIWMVLNVDLGCSDCYKNIKKILGNIPEIRDKVYDKDRNTVKITVVCCCPEKLRVKLYRKGKKVIKSIEIIKPAAVPPPPPARVVIGIPIPARYFPFEQGYGCPVCPGDNANCPFCHGYGNSAPTAGQDIDN